MGSFPVVIFQVVEPYQETTATSKQQDTQKYGKIHTVLQLFILWQTNLDDRDNSV